MILSLFRKTKFSEPVYAVYNAIVAQSRRPVFYAEWGASDTMTGRFDMISLHAALVFRRLRSSEKLTRDFSQNVFDCFFKDMDRSLREMGVGDLSVGKRIEKMGSLFYGTLTNLSSALETGDRDAVSGFVSRNFHDGKAHPEADKFADYILLCDDLLATQSIEDIMAGKVTFGEPK
ncbi:ubiquinol-cytochrome C chaperone family protein [Pelagibacterium luteolum]|uniref:Cytochrome b pre-mRNA-processing protein 3 n=1 Tax=Pelagibacterium luteolum TaxID=440168 RepID=A0A1G7WFN0_9HYPH|nr:ubiquinol-cytochrome C chaperone family protein [Pelagibacterium luteolum]SDG70756.1 cytochrome b pre-mRNA-processing protein 3 [Pelagibacterium luteolum]